MAKVILPCWLATNHIHCLAKITRAAKLSAAILITIIARSNGFGALLFISHQVHLKAKGYLGFEIRRLIR
jgi:hypothetical protein